MIELLAEIVIGLITLVGAYFYGRKHEESKNIKAENDVRKEAQATSDEFSDTDTGVLREWLHQNRK